MFRVYDENGVSFYIYDIKIFCELYDLNVNEMKKLIYGEVIIYNGFHNGIGFDRRANNYELYNSDNELIIVKNLAKFCRDNNLSYQSMMNVLSGKQRQHRGWSKEIITIEPNDYELYNSDNELIIVKNLAKFCRDNNLSYQLMMSVNKGVAKSHRGWSKKPFIDSNVKSYKMYNPQGDLVNIENMSKFCRDNKLSLVAMRNVMTDRQKQHKGWKSTEL